jgi:hypothetical protein
LRHLGCQNAGWTETTGEQGAIQERDYDDRVRLGEACFPGTRGRCSWGDGSAQAASAGAGSGPRRLPPPLRATAPSMISRPFFSARRIPPPPSRTMLWLHRQPASERGLPSRHSFHGRGLTRLSPPLLGAQGEQRIRVFLAGEWIRWRHTYGRFVGGRKNYR